MKEIIGFIIGVMFILFLMASTTMCKQYGDQQVCIQGWAIFK